MAVSLPQIIVWVPLLVSQLSLAAPTPGRNSHELSKTKDSLYLSLSDSETAVFAGGHFWSVEKFFSSLRKQGIVSTMTGYTGGTSEHPTQGEVAKGGTGHLEAVEVVFNPKKLKFEKLVEEFLRQTDPFDKKGQFCDRGDPYRTVIFYENEQQRQAAKTTIEKMERKLGKGKFVTELLPARTFHSAESINQEFFATNPVSYKLYLFGCGRDERLESIWGGKAN